MQLNMVLVKCLHSKLLNQKLLYSQQEENISTYTVEKKETSNSGFGRIHRLQVSSRGF